MAEPWRCSWCEDWQSSRTYARVVGGKRLSSTTDGKLWASYQRLRGSSARRTDAICPGCHLKVRKRVDGLQKNGEFDPTLAENRWGPSSSQASSQHTQMTDSQQDIFWGMETAPSQSDSSQSQQSSDVLPSSLTESQPSSSAQPSLMSNQDENVLNLKINSCKSTQSKCFICGSKHGRLRIPESELKRVWIKKRIWIPPNNRCCGSHLTNNKLTEEAMSMIAPDKDNLKMSPDDVVKWVHELTDGQETRLKSPITFDTDEMTSEDYQILTGVTRDNFDHLLSYLSNSTLKNSKNRSRRDALGLTLMKFRLNVSHIVLQLLFRISSIATVSDTIKSVTDALYIPGGFVDKNLGYGHISREEIMEQKSVESFARLVNANLEQVVLILDGTYLFVEKPSDLQTQWLLYSGQKGRHLAKVMMVVTTTGFILECTGIYGADGKNNDSGILKHMFRTSNAIRDFLEEEDTMILDRGFRDVIPELQVRGIHTVMPSLKSKKAKRFTTNQGNDSRRVTMTRWVVEAVNSHLKMKFPFFGSVIRNTHLPNLTKYVRIACAMLNAFTRPSFTESELHLKMVETAIERSREPNTLLKLLEETGMIRQRAAWNPVSEGVATDFPELSIEDLQLITVGTYQIKLAPSYVDQHLKQDPRFMYYVHYDREDIIRVKMQSRFKKRTCHILWIQFTPGGKGKESIKGRTCLCMAGEKTAGTCTHINAVLWYLGYIRFHPEKMPKKKRYADYILNAAEEFNSYAPDSDEDDEGQDEVLSEVE